MPISNFRFTPTGTVKLEEFLKQVLPGALKSLGLEVNNTRIRRLILGGGVVLPTGICRVPAYTLRKGLSVLVKLDQEKFSRVKTLDDREFEVTPKDIVFEDQFLLVVNKPPGIPTEGTVVASRDSVHRAAQRYTGGWIGVPHRLDKETSGVLLLLKDKSLNAKVHEIFASRQAQKTYLALCSFGAGNPLPSPGRAFTREDTLGRISAGSQAAKWGAVSGGLPAQTDFKTLSAGPEAVLIQACPKTGRTHQIRVHLSSLGLPLVGDVLYGWKSFGGTVPRVMLHALRLEIPHPVTGASMAFEAPVPQDFAEAVKSRGC